MIICGIDHVQLAMPAGREDDARRFYGVCLGLPERARPAELAGRGGLWFESGAVKIHLGVEADFRPARKAHPALVVDDLDALAERLRGAGVEVVDASLPDRRRFFAPDPFGNRIEFMAAVSTGDGTRPPCLVEPVVDHVQITVKDMERAVPFYDALLPLLGFDPARRHRAHVDAHALDVLEYAHPKVCFAVNSPRASVAADDVHRRRPGSLHHLAFRAPSRAAVDALHVELVRIGATVVSGPREFPEHTPAGYYAVFFKDPDGIKYEVVHTPVPH